MTEKTSQTTKRLTRSLNDRMVAGVAAGIADYFNIDASLIRIAFIFITLLGGSGVLAYCILWLVLPSADSQVKDPEAQIKANAAEIKMRAKTLTGEVKGEQSRGLWGLFLVGLGIIFLLQNFGLFGVFDWGKLWPLFLVILGFSILARR